jgi:hypothetical protein
MAQNYPIVSGVIIKIRGNENYEKQKLSQDK